MTGGAEENRKKTHFKRCRGRDSKRHLPENKRLSVPFEQTFRHNCTDTRSLTLPVAHVQGCLTRCFKLVCSKNPLYYIISFKSGWRKSRATKFCKMAPNVCLWVRSVELASCRPSGVSNFELAPRFLENLCTLGLSHTKRAQRRLTKSHCFTAHQRNVSCNSPTLFS